MFILLSAKEIFDRCERSSTMGVGEIDPEQRIQLEDERDVRIEIFLGLLFIIIQVPGTIFNIISVVFFSKQNFEKKNRLYFKRIYLMVSTVDLLICSTVFPMIYVHLSNRKAGAFGYEWFCYSWGVVWEILPHLSVFLVAVLSFSRMLLILFPLRIFSTTPVLVTIVLHVLFILGRTLIPMWLKIAMVIYDSFSGYCYIWQDESHQILQVVPTLELLIPIFPVSISFVIIMIKLKGGSKSGCHRIQYAACVTVVMVTLLYILFNIPVFINYIYYTIWFFSSFHVYNSSSKQDEISYLEYYGTNFLFNYSWGITYVLLVGINALLNPFIYFSRISYFRKHVCRLSKIMKDRLYP